MGTCASCSACGDRPCHWRARVTGRPVAPVYYQWARDHNRDRRDLGRKYPFAFERCNTTSRSHDDGEHRWLYEARLCDACAHRVGVASADHQHHHHYWVRLDEPIH